MIYKTIKCPCCEHDLQIPALTKKDSRISGQLCTHCQAVIDPNAYRRPYEEPLRYAEIQGFWDQDAESKANTYMRTRINEETWEEAMKRPRNDEFRTHYLGTFSKPDVANCSVCGKRDCWHMKSTEGERLGQYQKREGYRSEALGLPFKTVCDTCGAEDCNHLVKGMDKIRRSPKDIGRSPHPSPAMLKKRDNKRSKDDESDLL